MKKILVFCLGMVTLTLTSCLDTIEEFTIAANGSGMYKRTMDMSKALEMLAMLAQMDQSGNNELKDISEKEIDSVLSMNVFSDTASNLNAEEKALLKNGKMRITFKPKAEAFRIGFDIPFQRLEDVQKIMALSSNEGMDMMTKSTAVLSGKNGPGAGEGGKTDKLPTADKFFNMTIKDGLIERKLDPIAEGLKDVEEFKDMDMNGQNVLESMYISSVIHLPRPATRVTGELVKLSADKKTVTVKCSMKDLLSNPKSSEYRIEY
jgi:hypothetical protein